MPDALGSYGQHIVHEDFYHFLATAGNLGPGMIFGVGTVAAVQVIDETDGVIEIVTASGAGNMGGFRAAGVFSPGTNGPLSVEVRLKMPTVADAMSVGFATLIATVDEIVDADTWDGGTADGAAFVLDDGATDTNSWYAVTGTASAVSTRAIISTDYDPTSDEWQVLRVEINGDGSVNFYAADELGVGNGGLELVASHTAGSVSTTALVYPYVYVAANSGTATLDVDYFHFTANRNWNVE